MFCLLPWLLLTQQLMSRDRLRYRVIAVLFLVLLSCIFWCVLENFCLQMFINDWLTLLPLLFSFATYYALLVPQWLAGYASSSTSEKLLVGIITGRHSALSTQPETLNAHAICQLSTECAGWFYAYAWAYHCWFFQLTVHCFGNWCNIVVCNFG